MSKTSLFSVTLAACLALGACSDDESKDEPTMVVPPIDAPDSDAPTIPADGSVVQPAPEADAGTAQGSQAIPLIDWVDDLLDHHTRDDSTPDTVDDKNIADNEDPTTFDKRFQR